MVGLLFTLEAEAGRSQKLQRRMAPGPFLPRLQSTQRGVQLNHDQPMDELEELISRCILGSTKAGASPSARRQAVAVADGMSRLHAERQPGTTTLIALGCAVVPFSLLISRQCHVLPEC